LFHHLSAQKTAKKTSVEQESTRNVSRGSHLFSSTNYDPLKDLQGQRPTKDDCIASIKHVAAAEISPITS